MRRLCSLAAVAFALIGINARAATSEPLRIRVDRAESSGTSFVAVVDGQQVSSARLLDAAAEIIRLRGHEIPVVVMVNESAPLATLYFLSGVLGKAGFTHIRYFVFTSDRRMMGEVILGKAVPFTP